MKRIRNIGTTQTVTVRKTQSSLINMFKQFQRGKVSKTCIVFAVLATMSLLLFFFQNANEIDVTSRDPGRGLSGFVHFAVFFFGPSTKKKRTVELVPTSSILITSAILTR